MTTVVCNREMMSCDSLAVGGHKASVKKMWKHKGAIIGIAGTYSACVEFIRWLKGETDEEPDMQDVEAIMLTKDGRILHYEGTIKPFEVQDGFSAIGSGAYAAMAAMYMGATPDKAIEIAGRVDAFTGGRTQVYRRKPKS